MRPAEDALWACERTLPSRHGEVTVRRHTDDQISFGLRGSSYCWPAERRLLWPRVEATMQSEWDALIPAAQETAAVLFDSWAGTWEALLGTAAALEADS